MNEMRASQKLAPAAVRYGEGAIAFHWLVAALIAFLGVLGLSFGYIPKEQRAFWINLHVCVGLVYFGLVLARLAWRALHRPPDLPPDIGAFTRRTSLAAHHLLYALMVVVAVVGVVARVWHGRGFDYGLFRLDFGVAANRAVFEPAEEIHQWLAYGLLALAGVHAAAALCHHYVRRDGVLMRMLPGGTR